MEPTRHYISQCRDVSRGGHCLESRSFPVNTHDIVCAGHWGDVTDSDEEPPEIDTRGAQYEFEESLRDLPDLVKQKLTQNHRYGQIGKYTQKLLDSGATCVQLSHERKEHRDEMDPYGKEQPSSIAETTKNNHHLLVKNTKRSADQLLQRTDLSEEELAVDIILPRKPKN